MPNSLLPGGPTHDGREHRLSVEVASGCARDAETMRVENMLYLLEGGLDRVEALLRQEAEYRMTKTEGAQA